MAMDEKPPHLSVDSFDLFNSATSTTSSFEKLKKLGYHIRKRPLPCYLRGSIRIHPVAEIEPSRVGKGIWEDQLLIDRTIRRMAALIIPLAIGMIILIALYADHFRDRANSNTTSAGCDANSCKTMIRTNTACLLLINFCATVIVGMSNTYQQLVTWLTITDTKHVLCKLGDSRVGTNSLFSISQKREGRKRSLAAWLCVLRRYPLTLPGWVWQMKIRRRIATSGIPTARLNLANVICRIPHGSKNCLAVGMASIEA